MGKAKVSPAPQRTPSRSLSWSKANSLFGPRNPEAAEEQATLRAKQDIEIETVGRPGSPLVSVLMCVPGVLHIIGTVYCLTTKAWLCKPGDPSCLLPTTGPVRLGSYITFYFASWSAFPLHVTLLYATSMRRGSDIVQMRLLKRRMKKGNELDDLEVGWLERDAKKLSPSTLIHTLLTFGTVCMAFFMYLFTDAADGSMLKGSDRSTQSAITVASLFMVVPLIMLILYLTMRNLRVSLIRRKRGLAPAYVRKHIWPKVVNVVIVQCLLMLYFMATCLGSAQVPRTSIDGRNLWPGCPTASFNSTYIALYCKQTYASRLDTFVRECEDGGYDRFPSMLDSCEGYFTAQSLVVRIQACLLAGFSALLVVILPDYAFGLKEGLTWSNWFSRGSTRLIGAVILGFVGALCGVFDVLVVIHPETHGANEDTSFTGISVVHNLALVFGMLGWMSCMILLGTEAGVKKLSQLQELQEKKDKAKKAVKEQEKKGVVSFWFVKRSFILNSEVVPIFQQMPQNALEKVDISKQAVINGELAHDGTHLAVSHRWLDPREPDEDGAQTEAIRNYLEDHEEIQLVWFDFWCAQPEPRVPRQPPSSPCTSASVPPQVHAAGRKVYGRACAV